MSGAKDITMNKLLSVAVMALVLWGLSDTAALAETSSDANPYGLHALWGQGDWVARGTLVFLLLMSLASWALMAAKACEQWRLFGHARQARNRFWHAASLAQGEGCLAATSPFRQIAASGIAAAQHPEDRLLGTLDQHGWITMTLQRAVDDATSQLQGGLALLATVGSTAPFVGLFGTVWGIYHALTAIGVSGQASIDKVAGPVGEALIMTAIGLAVAVPAVMGYNILVRRNKIAQDQLRSFTADLHAVLVGGRPS